MDDKMKALHDLVHTLITILAVIETVLTAVDKMLGTKQWN